jgi:glutathione peroxidase-family protein
MPYVDLEKRRECLRRYRESHPDKIKENQRRYRAKSLEKRRIYDAEYRKKYPERVRETCRVSRKKYNEKFKARERERVDGLNDDYVRQLINRTSGLPFSQIPTALIEAKRIEIKLKRLIKEMK